MKIEDQITSLELSKRLKQLSVKQQSIFCWSEKETVPRGREYRLYYKGENVEGNKLDYSAFTSSELGDMLPWVINEKFHFQNIKSGYNWLIAYVEHDSLPPLICIIDDYEANCRAKMLIWLIENGYVKYEK